MLVSIGDHKVLIHSQHFEIKDFLCRNFTLINEHGICPDITVSINFGFGTPFSDHAVKVANNSKQITFLRGDYLIESSLDFTSAAIHIHDELALKHSLMNLYSSYIVHYDWGLLIHSSCVLDNGKAHIFAGHSGAGKSTAARLSNPRDLFSDEATLVKITSQSISVHDSPFRSEIMSKGVIGPVQLASIELLQKALKNSRGKIGKADALLNLMDKVFYWETSMEETKKIMRLLTMLVDRVPVYGLGFKKDSSFWELIS